MLRILVVCTANVCRSPVAERLLRRYLVEFDKPGSVVSAGTHGGRLPIHDDTTRAARAVDLDLGGHRSRMLTQDLIDTDGADLVITMTREHLRTVVGIQADAWPRAFTLKELARRGLDVSASVTDISEWTAIASRGRRASDLMSADPLDDLSDPYGGSYRGHVDMIAEVDALTRRIARLLPSPA